MDVVFSAACVDKLALISFIEFALVLLGTIASPNSGHVG